MEEFVLALVCIAVLYLLIKAASRGSDKQAIRDLWQRISWLEHRVHTLETSQPAAQAQAAQSQAPPQPVLPPQAPPQREVHIPPRRPAQPPPPAPDAPTPQADLSPAARTAAAFIVPREQAAFHQPDAPPPPRLEPLQPEFTAPVASFTAPPAEEPKSSLSFEERFGRNWLSKLGIISLVIGLASLLGLYIHNIGSRGKSALAMLLSFAILGTGVFFERRENYRVFARALIGGGWALIFFVTFALYHVPAMQVLHSQTVDLILMFLVATAMVAHSLRYKSQVVTSLAFLLAFVTVGISDVTMFSLVASAVLAVGLVIIAARYYWFELGSAGVAGVYINHFIWLQHVLPEGGKPGQPFPEFFSSAGLLLFYFLLFRLFYVLRVPRNQREGSSSSLGAILNSIGLLSLLKYQSSHPEWASWGLLILGTLEMVLAFVARPRWRTAFVVLSSIASVLLLAAIPFRFNGASWTLLWLLEAEMLFIAGMRLREPVLRVLGLLASFLAFLVALYPAALLVDIRQNGVTGNGHHWHTAIALFTAAAIYWINAEILPRRATQLAESDFDNPALRVMSFCGTFAFATALWVCVSTPWLAVAWILTALALGLVADIPRSTGLATQSDLLALVAVVFFAANNFFLDAPLGIFSTRLVTGSIVTACLYLSMRRKTRAHTLEEHNYLPAFYSWLAAALVAALIWYELPSLRIVLGWSAYALILFELGFTFRRGFLRYQAYALFAASFIRLFVANLYINTAGHTLSPRIVTVVPLIAAYIWVYERLQSPRIKSAGERTIGVASAWAGTIAAATLLMFEVRVQWVAIAWAMLAFILLAVAWVLKRPLFTAQSLVVLWASAIRAAVWSLIPRFATDASPATSIPFTATPWFCVGAVCAVMFLTLPIAFQIRAKREGTTDKPFGPDWRDFTLFRPEQPFFFTPLVLLAALLAVELHSARITIAWSALGIVVFLFALVVKERSYRLSGLILLMLGVGKIICVDIWAAQPLERNLTLVIMGLALLLVSFLYSRYKETLLRFL